MPPRSRRPVKAKGTTGTTGTTSTAKVTKPVAAKSPKKYETIFDELLDQPKYAYLREILRSS